VYEVGFLISVKKIFTDAKQEERRENGGKEKEKEKAKEGTGERKGKEKEMERIKKGKLERRGKEKERERRNGYGASPQSI
jgi:hypothetical protein